MRRKFILLQSFSFRFLIHIVYGMFLYVYIMTLEETTIPSAGPCILPPDLKGQVAHRIGSSQDTVLGSPTEFLCLLCHSLSSTLKPCFKKPAAL